MEGAAFRSFLMMTVMCAVGTAAEGQDRRDWQSLAQLQAGDRIRLSLKTGPVTGAFQNWTPQQVTAGTVTAKKKTCSRSSGSARAAGDGANTPPSAR
jgi:hypothetical protein